MILLIEGADCAGKTTLCEALMKHLDGAQYVHHTQLTNSITDFARTLMEASDRRREGKWTVIDRLWISEMIYGPIMRDVNRDPDGVIARMCHAFGVLTVMCVRSDITKHIAHFRETHKTRDEYAAAKIETVIQAYHDLWYGKLEEPADLSLDSVTTRPRNLFLHLSRFTPLRLMRSYYQYDMDRFTAEQFSNWLIRIPEVL
jgi:thymidylate kinase